MGFSPATSVPEQGVITLTAADASAVVAGTATDPTVSAGTLDAIASLHAPAANWSNNAKRITNLANGAAASDAATVGQLPTSGTPTGPAGGVLEGTYPNPGIASSVAGSGLAEAADVLSVNVDGSTLEISADTLRVKDLGVTAAKVANATLTDTQVAAANKDGAAGTASMRTLGTGAAQAVAGNDSRLTDSRPPSGAASGNVLEGTYPAPGLNAAVAGAGLAESGDVLAVNVDGSTLEISADALRVKDLGVTAAKVANATLTDTQVAAANKDGAAGTASMRTLGTGAAQAAAGNDARFTDSRTPSGPAGGKLTGNFPNPSVDLDILGGNEWTVVQAASDESQASLTVPQNDDELFFATTSTAVYEVELLIIYASPAGGATPDMKCDLGEDGTARGVFQTTQLTPTDAASQTNILADQSGTFTPGTAAGNRVCFVQGVYIGGGGTFRLRWSQNTSNINPTIRRAGSLLRYRRLDQ